MTPTRLYAIILSASRLYLYERMISIEKVAYHHGNLRNELIEAGIKIINDSGYSALSLRKAATMCGVSHAAPQAHFKNRKDFEDAIEAFVTDSFTQYLRDVEDKSTDKMQLVLDIGRAYAMYFYKHPNHFYIFGQKGISINASETEISSDYPPFMIFKKAAIPFFEELNIPTELYIEQILRMWALSNGLVSICTMTGFHYDGNWEQMVNRVINESVPIIPINLPDREENI